jgi:nucleotide-binding universal stress UspA family protein
VLVDPSGRLIVIGAWTLPPPVVTVGVPYQDEEAFRAEAARAVEQAEAAARTSAAVVARTAYGTTWDELVKAATAEEAGLIAVGSHGTGRVRGIVLGSTATEIVHLARCSVLVARAAGDGFPRRVTVGVDGSPQSADAYALAAHLATRFGCELWPVVAHGGKGVDKARAIEIVGRRYEELPDDPVRALVAASADSDLVVVGSRGLHGLRALGSVSERVAHQARCSTLVVRRPAAG